MTPEEIQQIFFVECEESLGAAEAGLAACRAGTQDADTVNAVFRAVHSIKGGAGAFGFVALQAYTHCFETLLSDVREDLVPLTEGLVDLLLRALDTLSDHVRTAQEGGDAPDDVQLIADMTAAMAANAGGASAPASTVVAEPEPAPEPAADDEFGVDFDSIFAEIAGGIGGGEPAAPSTWLLHLRPHGGALRNGKEPVAMLREIARLGGTLVACDCTALPVLEALDPRQGYLGWTLAIPEAVSEATIRELFDFLGEDISIAVGADVAIPPVKLVATEEAVPNAAVVEEPAPAPAPVEVAMPVPVPVPVAAESPAPAALAAAAPPAPPAQSQSIRIDLPKLDKLIDSVGELVIAQAMLAQRLESEGLGGSEELALLESLTRDIQESAMAIRAQPIGSVFSRVPRILRELAQSTGKHVKLELVGEATELDKTVIERLGEPLTHLIRNAVDHGIETAEERLAAGKSAEGTLTLSAEHRSGRILIRITDDGKGIDRKRVFAKAVEKGIVAADAQLSREEIDNLIFAPGFSTAATITNVSGRGVGMDVVRQNVKDLGGRITIESEEGKGASFILTLPLTLAISDGMIVNVGEQALVVPLAHVVESLRPGQNEVKGLGSGSSMLNVRGRFIPVVPVSRTLGIGEGGTQSAQEGVLIVVDTESAGQAALLVDDICDQRQFVIKSLDTNYRAVEGVAGATILGDGRVALILDVDGLVARIVSRQIAA